MGGSAYYHQMHWHGAYAPQVDTAMARRTYAALYHGIQQGWIRSCHDLSEGGLGVALAECVIGSRYGADISLQSLLDHSPELRWDEILWSESPSRFVLSVSPEHEAATQVLFTELPFFMLGIVTGEPQFMCRLTVSDTPVTNLSVALLRQAWQRSPVSCYGAVMSSDL
jgi:phosphoribosylformylglycinamidine synthase